MCMVDVLCKKTDTTFEDCVIQAQVEHQIPEGRNSNFHLLFEFC